MLYIQLRCSPPGKKYEGLRVPEGEVQDGQIQDKLLQCLAGDVCGHGVRSNITPRYAYVNDGSRSFLFGYDSGVMTDVIASPHFLKYFNTVKTSPTIGAINSTFSGGAVFGSLMGGFTMDRFGRKKTVQIGAFIAAVGAILQCAAVNLAMILVGRIIAGWAVGLMSMSIPVYQAECAHPKMRGLIVGLTQQMIGIGFIVSTWIGYGCHHAPDDNSVQWRFPLAFQIVPALLLLIGFVWLPESPRWCVQYP